MTQKKCPEKPENNCVSEGETPKFVGRELSAEQFEHSEVLPWTASLRHWDVLRPIVLVQRLRQVVLSG